LVNHPSVKFDTRALRQLKAWNIGDSERMVNAAVRAWASCSGEASRRPGASDTNA
jgi:hypothetical protein